MDRNRLTRDRKNDDRKPAESARRPAQIRAESNWFERDCANTTGGRRWVLPLATKPDGPIVQELIRD
jgi:hypothetical protein